MINFLILHPTGLLHKFMQSIFIFYPKSMEFCTHVPEYNAYDCHYIFYFGFVNENKDVFLIDDHIWKCQTLISRISQTQ